MQLAKMRANERRKEAAARAITDTCRRWGVNLTELSVALGLFAPDKGEPGRSMVSRWKGGAALPSAENQAMLDMLADGDLELRLVGRDGRRRIFDVVVPTAQAA